MADIDEQGRPEPEPAGSEIDTLQGFLDFQRSTLAWKCADVDAAGMRTSVAASAITLGGMLKHVAYVEDWWFSIWLLGKDAVAPWAGVDWDADPDWDWHSATGDTPEELLALWGDAVARSRASVAEALAQGGLDRLSSKVWSDGRTPNLRWILVHMIEEYARHNGHADIIRESIDGLTGE
jgi:uncharacterized damage-inducible protein DinB